MSLDLNKLANKLDEALSNETSETLTKFLTDKRMSNDKQKTGVDLFYDELVETTPFSISGIYALYKKAKKTETEMMIEFAKFHVESALKAVAENADVKYLTPPRPHDRVVVDMASIYNAYPLENIK